MCPEWATFEQFYADMGPRPNGASLDRIDNDRGYAPDNCRWATPKEQAVNRRSTVWVFLNGEQLTLTEASQAYGLSIQTLCWRLYKMKLTPIEAVTRPVRRAGHKDNAVQDAGKLAWYANKLAEQA